MDGVRKVIITGGSGRVGQFVLRQLVSSGFEVLNLDLRKPTDAVAPWKSIDLRDRRAVQATFEGWDAICHLGEIPGLIGGLAPNDLFTHNTTIASAVLQSAADLGIRKVIYTSTCQVYGMWGVRGRQAPAPLRLPMDESQPVNPQNAYAAAKVAAEHYARMLCHNNGAFSVTALRLPRVINTPINADLASSLLRNDGRVSELGTYVHAEDVAAAFVATLRGDLPGYRVFHLVADDVLTTFPIREALALTYPHFPLLPEDWPEHRSPVSTEQARRALGWQPRFAVLSELERWKSSRAMVGQQSE